MKNGKLIMAIAGLFVLVSAFQNCAQYEFSYKASLAEQDVATGSPFGGSGAPGLDTVDPNRLIKGDIADLIDSRQVTFPYRDEVKGEFVQRCSQKVYEQEKQEVLSLVKNDTSHSLIPVRFSISTGNIVDGTSYLAYQRSILKKDDDGVTEVYVGPYNGFKYRTRQGAFHYRADHTQARDNYIKGKRCFFDVIKVAEEVKGEVRLKGVYNHSWAILNYGNRYIGDWADSIDLSPRLFDKIENLAEPQIIPLYVADIREQYLGFTNENYTLLTNKFTSSAVRRKEYAKALKELFYLDRLFKHRDNFIEDLSFSQNLNNKSYSGYEGVSQLFDNIIFGYNATILSLQYTPIVLDLGAPNILTSSLDWGSFFNLAGIEVPQDQGEYKRISHQVAWLGGHLVQVNNEKGEKVWRRVADDGFLVLPNEDGEVLSSKQLFSNQTEVNGQTYANGFEALKVLAGKNCSSDEVTQKYVGPWDEAYETLKIWVDANRNGVSEEGEIKSLKESQVAALNPCFFNHEKAEDGFGNRTRIRAAYLYAEDLLSDGDISEADKSEIKARLVIGMTSSGTVAHFRPMVDIYFRAKPSFYLENMEVPGISEEVNNF